MAKNIRAATHSGTWYSSNSGPLYEQLEDWLTGARDGAAAHEADGPLRALICPHAGFSYSGRTAAHSYAAIRPEKYKRCIVLGPSHHVYLPDACLVSFSDEFAVPGGSLKADMEVVQKLHSTGHFGYMEASQDEAEHSIEMQLPYLAHVFKDRAETNPIKVVCIMVGSLSQSAEKKYGDVLSPWFGDPDNLFVISSDFCHWGERFRFTPYNPRAGAIWESISALDHRAMALIEARDATGFASLLQKEKNTICGQHPIGVFLHAADSCKSSVQVKFVRYEQSSKCVTKFDCSVSYAAGHARETL